MVEIYNSLKKTVKLNNSRKNAILRLKNVHTSNTIFNDDSDGGFFDKDYYSGFGEDVYPKLGGSLLDESEDNVENDMKTKETSKMTLVDHAIRNNAFTRWATSYHCRVRDSLLNKIASLYRRRHCIIIVLKAFVIFTRRRKLIFALNRANFFALNVIISRWRDFAATHKSLQSMEISAKVFHRSSVATKVLGSFLKAVRLSKEKVTMILRLVVVISRFISGFCLVPWIELVRKEKLLDIYRNKIMSDSLIFAKERALLAICSAYNCRKAATLIESLILRIIKRKVVQYLFYDYKISFKKETATIRCASLLSASTTFDHWNYLTKTKLALKARDFGRKSKAFNSLKRFKDRRYLLSKKQSILCSALDEIYQRRVINIMQLRMFNKRRLFGALCSMSNCIVKGMKRLLLCVLMLNSRRIGAMIKMELFATEFNKRVKCRLVFDTFLQYITDRNHKKNMVVLAEVNYKRFLISRVFQLLIVAYKRKMEQTNTILVSFQIRHKELNLRFFYRAFLSGIKRTKLLFILRGSIESRDLSRIALNTFMKFQYKIAQYFIRKLSVISSIGNSDLGSVKNIEYPILSSMYSTIIAKSEFHDSDILKGLMDKRISENALYISTIPLESECIIFLFFLLGLRVRMLDKISEYELGSDEFVVQLCDGLEKSDLTVIRSTHALLLHQARLEGLSASSPVKLEPINEAERLQSGASRTPEWLKNLLHKLLLIKIFNNNGGKDLHENISTPQNIEQCTFFDILHSRMPLWRLIFLKRLLKRRSQIFKDWRRCMATRKERKKRITELKGVLEEINSMSTRIHTFNGWLALTMDIRMRHEKAVAEICKKFVDKIGEIISKHLSFVFARLKLNFIVNTVPGAGRVRCIKECLKRLAISCRVPDCLEEVECYRMYCLLRCAYLKWLMHTKWTISTSKEARKFYRLRFLIKAWRCWYNFFLLKQEARGYTEQSIVANIKRMRLKVHFDGWLRVLRCRKIFKSFAFFPVKAIRRCFHHWKSFVDKKRRTKSICNFITQRIDTELLEVCFDRWMHLYEERKDQAELETQAQNFYRFKLFSMGYRSWQGIVIFKRTLKLRFDALQANVNRGIKNHYFCILFQIYLLRGIEKSRVVNNLFSYIVLVTASNKFYRVLDRRLCKNQENSLKESLCVLKQHRINQMKLENIANNKLLCSILERLSNLKFHRMALGLEILRENAKYRAKYDKIVETRNKSIMEKCNRHWRHIAEYNGFWIERIFGIKTTDITSKERAIACTASRCILSTVRICLDHWRDSAIACIADAPNKAAIIEFRAKNRIMEGLRILNENAMDKKWHALCVCRATMLSETREYWNKRLAFSTWRAVTQKMNNSEKFYDGPIVSDSA